MLLKVMLQLKFSTPPGWTQFGGDGVRLSSMKSSGTAAGAALIVRLHINAAPPMIRMIPAQIKQILRILRIVTFLSDKRPGHPALAVCQAGPLSGGGTKIRGPV